VFERLGDYLREGAADVFGFRGELNNLREASADARLLARAVEDVNWTNLLNASTGGEYFDPDAKARKDQTKRAYQYYFNDPVVRRTVDLRNFYCFGKGVPKPKYRDDKETPDAETELAEQYIDRYWNDPENRKVLTGFAGQLEKGRELQLQSNIFLMLVRSAERAPQAPLLGPDGSGDDESLDTLLYAEEDEPTAPSPRKPATLKVSDLPEGEIVDILMHPGNRKIPVLYKRAYTPLIFDPKNDTYRPGSPVVRYYHDWQFEAPTTWPNPETGKDEPWGPDESKIIPRERGVIYHISANKTSDMKFGITQLQSYLKWAQGLNQYMSSRMSTVQAIAAIAMQVKARGGARNVSQVASQIMDLSRLAGRVEGDDAGGINRVRADQGRTKMAVSNTGADLQPMFTDTASNNAQGDIQTMKAQVAAGSGVPSYQLGGEAPGLSSTTSMDAPLQKLIQADQEGWETVHRDLTGYMIEGVGLDPSRVEVQMPPILERDVGSLVAYMTALLATLDPNVSNPDFMRFVFAEVLDAMGKVNSRELIGTIFPDGMTTPFQQRLAEAQFQAGLMAAAGGGGGGGTPSADAIAGQNGNQNTPAQLAAGSVGDAVSRANGSGGLPNMPVTQAGDYSAIARDRARGRNERALQASTWGDRRSDFVESLPEPMRGPAAQAFMELDALIGQVYRGD
jgi:hypothetical protein